MTEDRNFKKYRKLSDKVYKRIYKLIDYSFNIQLVCVGLMTIFAITKQHLLLFLVFAFLIIAVCVIEYEKRQLKKRLKEKLDNHTEKILKEEFED